MEFKKRDIVEVAEELGIELEHHDADREYYTAFCPLHDNVNTPAFAIFPAVQRFYCYGCTPEGGDVIDLVRRKEGLTFQQAVKRATIQLSVEDAFVQTLRANEAKVDVDFLQMRAARINDEPRKLNFNSSQKVLKRFDALVADGRWIEADRLLRQVGV